MAIEKLVAKKLTQAQQHEQLLQGYQQELNDEIDRGNDLAKIIAKMVTQEPLEMFELERVTNIVSNYRRKMK